MMTNTTDYKKVASHEAHAGEFKKCLLLYSGGLDTSIMLQWIKQQYDCEVVTLTVDLGQTADDIDAIKQKALDLGATDAIVVDAVDQFADELLAPAIQANADYQDGYALGCPLGRVLISEIAVKIAHEQNCSVIAHGCTGKGNDQVRFESYITTLDSTLKIIAPVREWAMGRDEQIVFAEKNGIPISQTQKLPYSYDENLWANTAEGAEIEDPEQTPIFEQILKWCTVPEKACYKNELVDVEFEAGIPVSLNGEKQKLSAIIHQLNKIGGAHGVGFFPLIEDRLVGLKVRGVYENPAATILITAHKNLEKLVSTRTENQLKTWIDTQWAYLTYGAQWFEPTMQHLHAYIADQNAKVTGTVTLKLYKGNCTVMQCNSPNSLFDSNLATFDTDPKFNQNASAGFIEIFNLPQKTAYSVAHK